MVSMITSQNELGKNNTQSNESENRPGLKLNNFKYANVNVPVEQDMKMSKVTNHRILIRKAASLPVIYIFSRSGLKFRLKSRLWALALKLWIFLLPSLKSSNSRNDMFRTSDTGMKIQCRKTLNRIQNLTNICSEFSRLQQLQQAMLAVIKKQFKWQFIPINKIRWSRPWKRSGFPRRTTRWKFRWICHRIFLE